VTKAELRREMRQRLRVPAGERAEKSSAIVARIAGHPAFAAAANVALFDALPSEPDTSGLWLEKRGERCFCYPRVIGEEIAFYRVRTLDELTTAAWNPALREPARDAASAVASAEIDVILVPGLAFTRDGQRLGRGGGFYDRLLVQLPAHTLKLGVCFDFQIVERLPSEPHDQRVDAVVTEREFIAAKPLR
jgi:5-formyltetrahydrofolate cyclo-ligase